MFIHLRKYPFLHLAPLLHLGTFITVDASMLALKCNTGL